MTARALRVLFVMFGLVTPARAELAIDITQGRADPLPVAVAALISDDAGADAAGARIMKVVGDDLVRSGLFRLIDQRAHIETFETLDVRPRFADWQVLNAQALVQGRISREAQGTLLVEYRLWDVYGERQLIGQSLRTVESNWRRLAHIIADAIYERLTGETGYFDTRIVYVAESGPATRRVKRLAIMDQDGENHQFLTDGSALVLTPRFSPSTQQITYLSYFRGTPRVYVLDIETGRQELLGNFPGMTFAPRFSPDGSKVIMSMSQDGNAEIYELNLETRRARRLTTDPGIDTSPDYSPDGRQIVFNSDRGGAQQIYVMNADGGDVRRISFGAGRYATPVWSPRGDYVAFTKMHEGKFFIGVMRPDGTGERLLDEGFLVEGPTWAPNGRVLAYFDQQPSRGGAQGLTRLYTIDLTGQGKRRLTTPQDASDPAWSPLLHNR